MRFARATGCINAGLLRWVTTHIFAVVDRRLDFRSAVHRPPWWTRASSSLPACGSNEMQAPGKSFLFAPPDDPRHLLYDIFDSDRGSLDDALAAFEGLTDRTKDKLPRFILDSIFERCTAFDTSSSALSAETPPAIPNQAALRPSPAEEDHQDCLLVEQRLHNLERLYRSGARQFSEAQHLTAFAITLYGSASRIRSAQVSEELDYDHVFQLVADGTAAAVSRLESLTGTVGLESADAHTLAARVPWPALGLLARWLALYTPQANRADNARRVFYAFLLARHSAISRNSGRVSDCLSNFSDDWAIDTCNKLLERALMRPDNSFIGIKIALAFVKFGNGLLPSSALVSALLRRSEISSRIWHRQVESLLSNAKGSNRREVFKWRMRLAAHSRGACGLPTGKAMPLSHAGSPRLIRRLGERQRKSSLISSPSNGAHVRRCSGDFYELGHIRRGVHLRLNRKSAISDVDDDDRLLSSIIRYCASATPPERLRFACQVLGALFPSADPRHSRWRASPLRPAVASRAVELLNVLAQDSALDWFSLNILRFVLRNGSLASIKIVDAHILERYLKRAVAADPTLAFRIYEHLRLCDMEAWRRHLSSILVAAARAGDSGIALRLLSDLRCLKSADARFAVSQLICTMSRRIWDLKAMLGYLEHLERNALELVDSQDVCKVISVLCRTSSKFSAQRWLSFAKMLFRLLIASQRRAFRIQTAKTAAVLLRATLERDALHRSLHALAYQHLRIGMPLNTELGEGWIRKALITQPVSEALSLFQIACARQVLVRGPVVGSLMSKLVENNRLDEARAVNASWRGFAWRFRADQRGDDSSVLKAMGQLETTESAARDSKEVPSPPKEPLGVHQVHRQPALPSNDINCLPAWTVQGELC